MIMKSLPTILPALLLLSPTAFATSPTAAAAADSCLGTPTNVGYCTPLTYTDTTGVYPGNPTTADCLNTCAGVSGDCSVAFTGQDGGGLRKLVLRRPCGFAIAWGDSGNPPETTVTMNSQDILDLFEESLNRFGGAHGGRIAAEGTMTCGGRNIRWFIRNFD
ncbi:hypothetical protein F5Y17DRAFT_47586 [Xylariaceae sp. FL0594]|nr:hypothetical protein F5Y17DRAFT_47586 [Xylariaceae sp. FL0594]